MAVCLSMLSRNPDFESFESLLAKVIGSEACAKSIAAKFTPENLESATRQQLEMRRQTHERLMAAIELGRQIEISKSSPRTLEKISSSSDAIDFCRRHFHRLITDGLQEEFHIITLDTKNRPIQSHLITVGTLDASLVHPREVFKPAIRDSSSSIIAAHNHPSGDSQSSREDVAVTRRLDDAGIILGIDVLDHIVMGRDGIVSIREHNA